MWQYIKILFWPFDISLTFIQNITTKLFQKYIYIYIYITIETKLTWYWKISDQINTIERLNAKLKYVIKDKNPVKKKKMLCPSNLFFMNFLLRLDFLGIGTWELKVWQASKFA